jgi:hypothetical protein
LGCNKLAILLVSVTVLAACSASVAEPARSAADLPLAEVEAKAERHAAELERGQVTVSGVIGREILERGDGVLPRVHLGGRQTAPSASGAVVITGQDRHAGLLRTVNEAGTTMGATLVPQRAWATTARIDDRSSAAALVALHPTLVTADPVATTVIGEVAHRADELDRLTDVLTGHLDDGGDLFDLPGEVARLVEEAADATWDRLEAVLDRAGRDAFADDERTDDGAEARAADCDTSDLLTLERDHEIELTDLCVGETILHEDDTVTVGLVNRSPRWAFLYLDEGEAGATAPAAVVPPAGGPSWAASPHHPLTAALSRFGDHGPRVLDRAVRLLTEDGSHLVEDPGPFLTDVAAFGDQGAAEVTTTVVRFDVDDLGDRVHVYAWGSPDDCTPDGTLHAQRVVRAAQVEIQRQVTVPTLLLTAGGPQGLVESVGAHVDDEAVASRFAQLAEVPATAAAEQADTEGRSDAPIRLLHTATEAAVTQDAGLLDVVCDDTDDTGALTAHLALASDAPLVAGTAAFVALDVLASAAGGVSGLAASLGTDDGVDVATLVGEAATRAAGDGGPLHLGGRLTAGTPEAALAAGAERDDPHVTYLVDRTILDPVPPPLTLEEVAAQRWPVCLDSEEFEVGIDDAFTTYELEAFTLSLFFDSSTAHTADVTGNGGDDLVVHFTCNSSALEIHDLLVFTRAEDGSVTLLDPVASGGRGAEEQFDPGSVAVEDGAILVDVVPMIDDGGWGYPADEVVPYEVRYDGAGGWEREAGTPRPW